MNLRTYQRQWRINRNLVQNFLQKAWQAIKTMQRVDDDPEVTIVFLNDTQMRSYNKQYRKRDYPTDVLSFPVNEIVENRCYLGDILISMQTTAKQAREKNYPINRELKVLLLHGMLHLLGYDHETDSGQMDQLERRLRKGLI